MQKLHQRGCQCKQSNHSLFKTNSQHVIELENIEPVPTTTNMAGNHPSLLPIIFILSAFHLDIIGTTKDLEEDSLREREALILMAKEIREIGGKRRSFDESDWLRSGWSGSEARKVLILSEGRSGSSFTTTFINSYPGALDFDFAKHLWYAERL